MPTSLLLLTLAAAWHDAPALPRPTGEVVRVRTVDELQRACRAARSGQTILLAPGEYRLEQSLHLTGGLRQVALRGATGRPEEVVLRGRGMFEDARGTVPHGVILAGVEDALIADLTIRDVWFHPVTCQGGEGCRRPRLYHCRLINAGEQFVKANPGADGVGVEGGTVEHCLFEYEDPPRHDYTNGVDVIGGRGWVIRHNLFRNLRAPQGQVAGPAILMWKGTRETICEGNLFWNCQRMIHYGLDSNRADDHAGGRIEGNRIWQDPGSSGDCGIALWNSAGTVVRRNTVLLNGSFPNAIEYRFAGTAGARIEQNLCDAAIASRDGGRAELTGNVTGARLDWFVAPAQGDFRLAAAAAARLIEGGRLPGAPAE